MMEKFYSNGKLLITGEYVVLDGASAFALPTRFGQDLVVEPGLNREIHWKGFDYDGSIWFEDTIGFDEITAPVLPSTTESVRATLIRILHEAYLKNSAFLASSGGYVVTTHLTFPKSWGLGSSSTLINNIAQWLKIDAFELLWNSFGGSGYDIACAQNDSALRYKIEGRTPIIETLRFEPPFAASLYFVYLNQKQSSKAAIASYRQNRSNRDPNAIAEINAITNRLLSAENVSQFAIELQHHESVLSKILQMKTIKEQLFADFNGTVKSLGGWGGDFVMAVSETNPTPYFTERGFNTVIRYNDMIL